MFKKWLGVRGSSSFGLDEFLVSGLDLAIRSASVNTVWSTSSLIRSLPRIAFGLRFTDFTSLSQTPDMCDAPGGWNTYLQPRCCNSFPTFSLSICSIPFLISRSASTKFDPLSERSSFTCPLRLRNLIRTKMKSSVSRDLATSRWMAREFIQTKMSPHLFSATVPLPLFT